MKKLKIFLAASLVVPAVVLGLARPGHASYYKGRECAQSAEADNAAYQKFWDEHKKIHALLHGNSPYYFSNAARPRFWSTPEEQGHYVLGYLDKPLPELPEILESPDAVVVTPPAILIASSKKLIPAPAQMSKKETATVSPASSQVITPRINDSQDIPRVIEEHQWKFESEELAQAAGEGSK